MHYTGTIWRPPYEATSLLLEVTAGCTHHKCKFCTLYNDLPFKFKLSPFEDIEADLKEASVIYKRWGGFRSNRVFLTGANPFVLSFEKLMDISHLIHKYLPNVKTIGSFARITDVTPKTDEQLQKLHEAGYDGLTIGIETGDDEALAFMNKGYKASDIVAQCKRLDKAGIHYSFFYLTSISGAGRGEILHLAGPGAKFPLQPVSHTGIGYKAVSRGRHAPVGVTVQILGGCSDHIPDYLLTGEKPHRLLLAGHGHLPGRPAVQGGGVKIVLHTGGGHHHIPNAEDRKSTR